MKTRIIAGAAVVAVLLAVLILAPAWVAAIFMGLVSAIASYELLWGIGLVKHVRLNIYSALIAFGVAMWSYFGCHYPVALMALLLYSAVLFAEMMGAKLQLGAKEVFSCLASGLLIPFLLSALVRIGSMQQGKILVAIPFVMAFLSDTGADFVGVTMGKHKMAPLISPKKSWEGFVGGIVIAALSLMLYGLLMEKLGGYKVRYILAAVYGLAGALGSVFGDLSMSVIKRQTGIKDYGKLIPGHGGILDRFDSVMITAPLTEALLLILPFVV